MGKISFSLGFIFRKSLYFTNKYALLSGSIIGFFVPITNGIVTGNWFWLAYNNGQFQSFFIDVFWLILAIITLLVTFKIKKKETSH